MKKLREVMVGETNWRYSISVDEVRIYEPGTKQIKVRVKLDDMPKRDGIPGIGPGSVRKYIEANFNGEE